LGFSSVNCFRQSLSSVNRLPSIAFRQSPSAITEEGDYESAQGDD
jgi:hypothetical protein